MLTLFPAYGILTQHRSLIMTPLLSLHKLSDQFYSKGVEDIAKAENERDGEPRIPGSAGYLD